MLKDIIIRCGPQTSMFEVGAWQQLPTLLQNKKVTKALVIHGEVSWKKFSNKLPETPEIELIYDKFNGECTYDEAKRIANLAKQEQAQAIISIGGGKNNDCVKMAGNYYDHITAMLPTLAATCAAWTPVCVMYNDLGEMVDFPILNKATDILLVDPSIILDSPKAYLVAGIGDTLAKWYESDVIIRQLSETNSAIRLAHYNARLCYENIIAYSQDALAALDAGILNTAFTTIVETNIMISGLVGGFGNQYARTAAAHSIHDALTLLPQTHTVLHGNKVAYGLLVQLLLENRPEEVQKLIPFYLQIGLPIALKDINLANVTQTALHTMAERATIPEEDIHLLPEKVTVETLLEAIAELNEIEKRM